MLKKFTTFFSSTLNLIRAELFFGACFAQFYALLFSQLGELKYSQLMVNIYSFAFISALIYSFIRPDLKKEYRIVSNALYFLANVYILFVAYMNNYDQTSFFLVIFNYAFITFSMPNIKTLGIVIAAFFWIFIMSYLFLNFEPQTPFWVAFLSLLFISIASYFIVFARNVYQSRIKEKERLLDHIFNGSGDGMLLICKKSFVIEKCNSMAEKILGFNQSQLIGNGILDLKIRGKAVFEHLDIYTKETIELDSKEIIHYQKKSIDYPNYSYLLIQVKRFKSKALMKDTFKLSWR